MDVRVCGDANQDLRFAFLEFAEERSVEPVRLSYYPWHIVNPSTARRCLHRRHMHNE